MSEPLHNTDQTDEIPLPSELREPWSKSNQKLLPHLIVLTGPDVGRMFSLVGDDTIVGRSPDADLVILDDGVSRAHARFTIMPDGKVRVTDLQSRNGTWVEGRRVDKWLLSEGERLLIGNGTVIKLGYRDPVEAAFVSTLYESATRDSLTGLLNRRWLLDHLVREVAWHKRHERPLSLILVDVDHFKQVNDNYGHMAGDEMLRQVGEVCLKQCRTEDVFARFGGDEFACVLRETPVDGGEVVAHRLCSAVAEHTFCLRSAEVARVVPATVSVGLATKLGVELRDAASLVASADRYLYLSKELGRNRVAAAQPAG